MYCVKFLDPLRGKIGDFYRRKRRQRRGSVSQVRAFFSLLSSVRKDLLGGSGSFPNQKAATLVKRDG